MKNAFAVAWGMLVDDKRLAGLLLLFLALAGVLVKLGATVAAGAVIWIGLVASLFVSIRHQLRLKLKK